jgi:hypothetical protein
MQVNAPTFISPFHANSQMLAETAFSNIQFRSQSQDKTLATNSRPKSAIKKTKSWPNIHKKSVRFDSNDLKQIVTSHQINQIVYVQL